MPLDEREAEFPLVGGLDTKEHAELEDPSSVRELDGFRFGQLGRYERMTAVKDYLTITPPSGSEWGTSAVVHSILALGDEPVGITDHFGLVTVAEENGTLRTRWKWRDTAVASGVSLPLQATPTACTVSREIVTSLNPDSGYTYVKEPVIGIYQGYLVMAWAEGTTRVVMRAYDLVTGYVIAATEYTATRGDACMQACTLNEVGKTGVLITWCGGTTIGPHSIYSARFDSASRSFIYIGSLATCQYGEHALVASTSSNRVYLAYQDNATGFLRVDDRSTTAITSTHNGTHDCRSGVAMLDVGGGCLIVSGDYTNRIVVSEMFGTPGTLLTLWTGTGVRFRPVYRPSVCAQTFAASGYTYGAEVFVTTSDTTTFSTNQLVESVSMRYDGGTMALFSVSRDVDCSYCVGAFSYDGRAYGIFRNGTDDLLSSPTYLVGRVDCDTGEKSLTMIARIAHDRAATSSGVARAVVSSTQVLVASAGDSIRSGVPQSVFLNRIDFGAQDVPFFEHAGCVYFSCGTMQCYDGVNVFEATPTRPAILQEGSGSTTVSAKAYYEFTDNKGNLHRGAPGPAVTFAAATSVYAESPGLTAWDGSALPSHRAVLYRNNGAGGSSYYYFGTAAEGSITGDGQYYSFGAVSAAAGTEAELYTDGGELPADAPPAFHHVCVIGDRAWGIHAENRSEVWFTKPFVAGYAPEWSSFCKLYIGDDAEAVCDVGGVPTILGKRGIWQVYGEGPNANGVGEFAPARRLPHEVGCVTRASVCKTPMGVFFQSEIGYVVLGNDLAINPIGLPIAPETRTTTSQRAIYDRTHNEIRVINGYFTYLYSIDNGKWSRRTNSASNSSEVDPDDIVFCDGRVWSAHNGGAYIVSEYNADDTSSYAKLATNDTVVETPWIKFDGVAGFGKLWRMIMPVYVPQDTASSSVTIEAYTDYDASTVKWVHTFSTSDVADWGTNKVETLTLHPRYQKIQSIKLRWTQSPSGGGIRAAITPLAIRFKYGVTKNSRPSYNRGAPGAPPS